MSVVGSGTRQRPPAPISSTTPAAKPAPPNILLLQVSSSVMVLSDRIAAS
ncbi:hypothetical protein [Photorhabdus australis]